MLVLSPTLAERSHTISLTFHEQEKSFAYYKQVFEMLSFVEGRYRDVREHMYENARLEWGRSDRAVPGSRVFLISKQSPLEVGAFVADNWLELLLFFVGIRGNVVGTIKELYRNFDKLVDDIERLLKEQLEAFPAYEIERLKEVWSWFMALNADQQQRIQNRLKFYSRVFHDLRKVMHDRAL